MKTKQIKIYELINKEKCTMGYTSATSIRKARANFERKFSGEYIIIGEDVFDKMNVNLK